MSNEEIIMTEDERVNMLNALQSCFTEASALTSVLRESEMITDTMELQQIYTESVVDEAISEAILESLETGPIFEKVEQADKQKIVKIVHELRPKIESDLKGNGISFYKTSVIGRLILGLAGIAGGLAIGGLAGKAVLGGAAKLAGGAVAKAAIPGAGAAIGGAIAKGAGVKLAGGAAGLAAGAAVGKQGGNGVKSSFAQIFQMRAWQIIGVVHMEEGNIESLCNKLSDDYSNTLGEYKIIYVKALKTIYDAFKTHFGWKDARKAYFLIVDKKIPNDLQEISATEDEGEYTDVVDK